MSGGVLYGFVLSGGTSGAGGTAGKDGSVDVGPSDGGDAGDTGRAETSDAVVSEAGFSKEVFFNE